MAIIKCPECGKEVSDKANACPNCGYPFEEKSDSDVKVIVIDKKAYAMLVGVFIYVVFVIIICIISRCINNNDINNNTGINASIGINFESNNSDGNNFEGILTEEEVINKLKTVEGITEIEAATEDNDPNEQLHKSGGYNSDIFFTYDLVDKSKVSGNTVIQKGTDGGGSIEIYNTVEEANKRKEYLASFDGTILSNGTHTVLGTMVVRTSCKLTATQQKELEEKLIKALSD